MEDRERYISEHEMCAVLVLFLHNIMQDTLENIYKTFLVTKGSVNKIVFCSK